MKAGYPLHYLALTKHRLRSGYNRKSIGILSGFSGKNRSDPKGLQLPDHQFKSGCHLKG